MNHVTILLHFINNMTQIGFHLFLKEYNKDNPRIRNLEKSS